MCILGIENLLKNVGPLKGGRVGLIANAASVDRNLTPSVDLLYNHPEINLVKVFGPQQGLIVPHKIIAVTGVRRAGKTYFLYQIMQSLIEGGLAKQNILYLNFEDDRLNGITVKERLLKKGLYLRLFLLGNFLKLLK